MHLGAWDFSKLLEVRMKGRKKFWSLTHSSTAVLINPNQHSLLPFAPVIVVIQSHQHLILRKTATAINSRIALLQLDSTVCQDSQLYHENLVFSFSLWKITLLILTDRIPQVWSWQKVSWFPKFRALLCKFHILTCGLHVISNLPMYVFSFWYI